VNLEQHSRIPVARERLWQFLLDVPRMAPCVPGVESLEPRGEDRYAGRLKVRVGPIGLTLDGNMRIKEQDAAAYRAALEADASDRRVGGGLHALAGMALHEIGPEETELVITTEARLLGKLGEFGQPVIRKKADGMMADFARNVAAALRKE
jgi:carbon monoxide dehydrogenase subunit G